MRASSGNDKAPYQKPQLIKRTKILAQYIQSLPLADIQKVMAVSPAVAQKTHDLMQNWSTDPKRQLPAMDSFLGDIYSGLRVQSFNEQDRLYSNSHLSIISGLYGMLRPLDSIMPYRVEMAYKFSGFSHPSLYSFWDNTLAQALPIADAYIDVSAAEYTKAIWPHLPNANVITPKFMTISSKTGEPTFVVVHAKIARGAFARWLITNKIKDATLLSNFNDLGYRYNKALSSEKQPVFVCQEFKGLGLSVRKT